MATGSTTTGTIPAAVQHSASSPGSGVGGALSGLPAPPGASTGGGLADYSLGNLANTVLVGSANIFGTGQDLSFTDALSALAQADPQTAAQIQNQLLIGGFYPRGATPLLGTIRPQDQTAFKNALMVPARAGANVSDYLQTVADASQQTGPLGSLVETTTHAIDLTDPAAIGDQLDQMYEKALGRKPRPDERTAFTTTFQANQKSYYDALYGAQDSARRNYLAADAARQQTQNQQRSQQAGQLDPGLQSVPARYRDQARGDNFAAGNSAIAPDDAKNYGDELAGKYGLTVTSWKRSPDQNKAVGGADNSDHLTGMAVDVASNPSDPRSQDKMNALAQWAHQNEGPGKLFRWVGWQVPGHYDHVHLSFNGQVTDQSSFQQLQQLQSNATPPGQGTAGYNSVRDTFLGALKGVEHGVYDWVDNGVGARGAYQFMPSTWATAARLAGIDPGDHSQQGQDAAARALVDQYYQQFNGNWSLVAAAWNGGAGSAKRVQADPTAANRISDGKITLSDYMQRVMGAFTAAGGMNGGTGLANDVMQVPLSQSITRTSPDLSSDAIQYARQQNPIESSAHDMAQSYDVFTKLLGGVVNVPGPMADHTVSGAQ